MSTLVIDGLLGGTLVTGGLADDGATVAGATSLVIDGLRGGVLVTRGLGFGADEPEPEPVTEDFWAALRLRLLAEPTLDDLTEVYNPTTGTRPAYPFLVVNQVGDDDITYNTSDSHYLGRLVQFTVLTTDQGDAVRLSRAAHASLEWDRLEPILFAEGYEMARFPDRLTAPREQSGVGPGGLDVFLARFQVTFMIGSR